MSRTPKKTIWLSFPGAAPGATLRLFCFPYAGGGARIYRNWPRLLAPSVEVCAANLPGREGRLKERPFTQMDPLIEALAENLGPFFDRPFAFFGHSMGAMISFELARRLRRTGGPMPVHLFVSGRRAPQLPDPEPPTYDLPRDEFIDSLRRLNGTPHEVLQNDELLQLVIPLLRADFELVQTYDYREEVPLDCPITAFAGLDDVEVSRDEVRGWERQTTKGFSHLTVPGDHFFIHADQPILFHRMLMDLARV